MAAVSVLHILRSIRENGPISRTSLQQITGLSWGTITNATRSLLNRRLIREERVETAKAGRKPVHLSLNRDEHCIIGLELGIDAMRCIAMNPAGETLGFEQGAGIHGETPEIALDRMAAMARRALADNGGRKLMGTGISAPGAIDANNVLMSNTRLHGWAGVAIRAELEKRLGMEVQAECDTNCLALVERWFGEAAHSQDVLCICLGETVGMGILLGGIIFRGSQGKAGEFGHMTVDPEGPPCHCGDRGCVEVYCSLPAVLAGAPGNATLEELIMRARGNGGGHGESPERSALEAMGRKLGIAVANAVDLFDPELVVIAGKLAAAWEWFSPAMLEEVDAHTDKSPKRRIAFSRLGPQAAAMGACAMVLQAALGDEEPEEQAA
jgi:predicted NBD/HSP70 family sugar kinase